MLYRNFHFRDRVKIIHVRYLQEKSRQSKCPSEEETMNRESLFQRKIVFFILEV